MKIKIPEKESGAEENVSSSITLGIIIFAIGLLLIVFLILLAVLKS